MSWDLQVAVGSHSYALLAYGDQVVLPWCTCWAGMRAMRWPRCASAGDRAASGWPPFSPDKRVHDVTEIECAQASEDQGTWLHHEFRD